MKLATVIILTSGRRERYKHMEQLLESLTTQTYKNFELILATERMDRELVRLFNKYFRLCDKHRIIVTGYWNKCRTANKAIEEARGDIIFLLEDDLVLERRFIEILLQDFELYPYVGCVYSRCIWVYREGLSGNKGLAGFMARLISKLSLHESLFRKQVKRINNFIYEVPVFTMSVACRKEALYKAGLYDDNVEEPILGEDFDLAIRVRKAGYKIIQDLRAISLHYTRQVTKARRLYKEPRYLENQNLSELYFMTKNIDLLKYYTMSHAIYRILNSLAWGIRLRSIKLALHGIAGIVKGFVKGLSNRL